MMDDALFAYMESEEDAFFGSRKKRKRKRARRKKRRTLRQARPEVIARKERQKVFVKKLGNVYRDIGGATGIGQAVDSLLNPITPPSSLDNSNDFEIRLTPQDEQTPRGSEAGVPTIFFVIGGLLVLGVVTLVIYKKRQAK
ncbi:hypothetical protein ACFO3O_06295 [Dokdonia ponticola]|uniref:LPXTG cell wall anchor domain-containing protein n=1 Tax=Dokdonia ponticola TaxID=2041041 RepID=A0ABV9HUI5_9FLAO